MPNKGLYLGVITSHNEMSYSSEGACHGEASKRTISRSLAVSQGVRDTAHSLQHAHVRSYCVAYRSAVSVIPQAVNQGEMKTGVAGGFGDEKSIIDSNLNIWHDGRKPAHPIGRRKRSRYLFSLSVPSCTTTTTAATSSCSLYASR